ncbi:aminotransferase class I/II-fold pyridoxal phosphate-dependent enzyme [Citricoccus sp.]|uniref:pyridoxal phosphate-dependent aminotransferase n=1 Tax=Citricoccus sp. TaxID=1978372 RepID=UPI002CFDD458|nr:aminotransferase class I/II-fold pyridoxal phosphate-dependent enzyme [Citricoccus sp.]HRO31379.1 aminotransferase class I/II-fold pyridoxal phosphate-dependent enzyme [Citricoccus sp.]
MAEQRADRTEDQPDAGPARTAPARRPLGPSSRSQVPDFEVMTILGRVSELRAAGHDVVSLCAGEPGGGAPAAVNQRAAEIHASGRALNYTPSLGIVELRQAIAGHYRRWYGLDVDPARVAVTTGSSGAFMAGFLAAFNAGDRVAMARPGYAAYRNILTALGCQVVEIDAGAEVRYQPTPELLEQAEADHGPLAGLILASPNNPTGTMATRAEVAVLASWCRKNSVRLVSDEIYHGITYADGAAADGGGDEPGDERGVCAWEYSTEAMVISSFSKYWGMPGWRIGWMLMPEDLVPAIGGLSGSVSLCPPAAAQYAAVEAFAEESYAACDEQVAGFARARALLLDNQERLGWTDAAPADGAFYFYATPGERMLAKYGTSTAYCEALLEQAHVALTPGTDFDTAHGDQYIRLSFAAGHDAVREAIERIVAFQRG